KLATDLILNNDYELKEKFELLLAKGEITEVIDEHLEYGALQSNRSAIWSLLLMSGYLKVIRTVIDDFASKKCTLVLPNTEVLYFYYQAIQQWLSNEQGASWFQNFLQDLLDAKIDKFEEKLQTILLET